MNNPTWKQYAFWIGLSEAVGGLAWMLTREGQQLYNAAAVQPPLSPPAWVFPVVWGILYALMGFSAARIAVRDHSPGLNLFIAQLTVNFFWSLLFFNAQRYGFAAIWLAFLIVLVILMIRAYRRADRFAALHQLPYLIWLCFALYLNIGVWRLNP